MIVDVGNIDLSWYYRFIYAWMALGVLVFFVALRVIAPYGRHVKKGWGSMMDNKTGWIIYESPSIILVTLLFMNGTAPKNLVAWILFLLFFIHYFHRTFIYPLRIKTKGKKIPLGIVISALIFNIINGFLIGYYLGYIQNYSSEWIYDPRFIIGLILFVVGMGINLHSDTLLIHLRKNSTGYKIPYGGFFNKVSCANLFGEVIEWIGYALMMWAWPGFAFALWTCANLIPRALDHHKWYLDKFENYPSNRKAIFPYIL